jgi:two-component sensor histidine kinase
MTELLGSHDLETRVDPEPVLSTLAGEVRHKHLKNGSEVTFSLAVRDVALKFDQLVPLVLLSRELLANAFLHAEARKVSFLLEASNGASAHLVVSDDGRGLPTDFEERRARRLGLELVRILSDQLGGNLTEPVAGAPSEWSIRFPLER